MTHRFIGKVALVTGASEGIGAATARAFAAEGAKVVLCARRPEPLRRLSEEIRARGGLALPVAADVADLHACGMLVQRAKAEYGGIDILVNNAGCNRRGPAERFPAEELAQVIQVNLVAPIVLCRLVLPHLRERGGGAIVNVASLAGRIPVTGQAVYSASKFGLRAFSFALREELEYAGIRVSCVSPGPVDTGFLMEAIDDVADLTFAQPMSSAQKIADLVLASAADGKAERATPALSGYLATLGYLFPALRRLLVPVMERRGRRIKEKYRAQRR